MEIKAANKKLVKGCEAILGQSSLIIYCSLLYIHFTPFITHHHIPSHVQVSNDDALEFYQKFGFHIVDTKEQYYKRIDPPHAFVLQKDMKGPLGLPIVS